jgi:hypothetical protein
MKEEIHFGFMGNGITVWDAGRTRNGDYLTVAHISYERSVKFYEDVSPGARRQIENFAKYGNTHPVSQPEMLALRPLKGSAFMSSGEKGRYLRDNDFECPTEYITSFLREVWDDTKTPPENLIRFKEWRVKGK